MAAAFRPVNVNSPLASASEAATTTIAGGDVMTPSPAPAPSTPRPSTAPDSQHESDDHLITPTRSTFSPSVGSRQQYPASVYSDSTMASGGADRSKRPRSHQRDSMEMDIDDDGSPAGTDDGAASDDESVNADGTRSNKKKKSQRFYCTDYPPCSLSFTRSEHLARHIRKHTGERPFQCHCSRRFSRLDNLRQHAQTVHVNEDIPIDSLAATGSRFQRQMRTDRVRQAGNRARASTSGSAGGPPRGHSKSLSTSSINSVTSVGSNNYSTTADPRRRPPPLVMADPRRPVDPYRTNENPFAYRPASPSEFSTPTSATFSTGQNSPRWSGMPSPSMGHSRSQSMYTPDGRTHARRLSVPSAAPPFQHMPGRPMFGGAGPMNSSNGGAFSPAHSNLVTSPTASNASGWSRRESTSTVADEAWRRRTWHPESPGYSSGHGHSLSNASAYSSINPDPRPPMVKPNPNSQSTLQLPGIESFDQQNQAPVTPPARRASPMMVDPAPRPPTLHSTPRDMSAPEDRRNLNVYDASMHRGPQRSDYGPNTPPREIGAWAHETSKAVQQAQLENSRAVRFEGQPPTSYPAGGPVGGQGYHQQTMSAPSIATTRASKRRGWYNGPMESHREEARPAQDPRASRVERMVHPNFAGFSGIPAAERQQSSPHHQQQQQPPKEGSPESLRRLEALVAVATSEGSKTAAAY